MNAAARRRTQAWDSSCFLKASILCNALAYNSPAQRNQFHGNGGGSVVGVLPVDPEHVVSYLQFESLRFPVSPEMTDGNGHGAEARRSFVEKLVGRWAFPVPSLLSVTDFSRVHLW